VDFFLGSRSWAGGASFLSIKFSFLNKPSKTEGGHRVTQKHPIQKNRREIKIKSFDAKKAFSQERNKLLY
jgi:hypothetical protein